MDGIIITGMIIGGILTMILVISHVTLKETKLKARVQGAGDQQAGINAATEAELARLRDRVAVLERLLTDDDRRLAREIDGLAARPLPDAMVR